MSLIGDALRKTRQEAAERESDRKGVIFSAKIADSPTRSNLGLGLALGAVIAVAATVAGGGAVWWLMGRGETPPTGATETVLPVPPAINETGETPAGSISPSPSEPDPQGRTVASDEPAPKTATETETVDFGSDPPATNDPVAAESTETTGTSDVTGLEGGFTGVEDGAEVYILEANLGAVQLSLDFIIFRADDPFAEINGVELHLGGVIEGYRVKAIDRDRVHLSNGRKDIVLRAP